VLRRTPGMHALLPHSLHTHCTLTAHSLHTHCTLTAHSLHTHCTLTALSLPLVRRHAAVALSCAFPAAGADALHLQHGTQRAALVPAALVARYHATATCRTREQCLPHWPPPQRRPSSRLSMSSGMLKMRFCSSGANFGFMHVRLLEASRPALELRQSTGRTHSARTKAR
jgi:hypothetical protein